MSSTEPSLRVAIVGAGLMGRWHAHYARRNGARIVGIVDGSARAAAHLARRVGGVPTFDDLDASLAAARPQLVHVCTPLASHAAIAMRAIEAGAHVLVEKPLAPTAAETRALMQRAATAGVVACPVHQFAFQRGVVRAAQALADLGEPLHASFSVHSAGAGSRSDAARDALVADILPHPLSVLQALWPRRELAAREWTAERPRPGELFARGRSGQTPVSIHVSLSALPTRCDLEISCTGGSVLVNFFHGYSVVLRGSPSRLDKIARPFLVACRTGAAAGANLAGRAWRGELAYPGLDALVASFYAAARGSGVTPVSAADSLAVAEMRDHLIQAAMPGAASAQPGSVERERARVPR